MNTTIEVDTLLGMYEPWSLEHVLMKLIEASEILLHDKNYDGHGWEEINICVDRAKEIIIYINENKPLAPFGDSG